MHIKSDSFWAAKHGALDGEYEDASWPSRSIQGHFGRLRLAVADGASESSFSGLWARLLVQGYRLGYVNVERLVHGLDGFQQAWRERLGTNGPPLPWYAEAKLAAGTFAALAGLTLTGKTSKEGEWQALAMGDCCLFQVRGDEVLARFPLSDASQFDSRPFLVSTKKEAPESIANHLRTTSGTWQVGDEFFLMSDALACWFLKLGALPGGNPVEWIHDLTDQATFEEFVRFQRNPDNDPNDPVLKNDDVTLVRCKILAD